MTHPEHRHGPLDADDCDRDGDALRDVDDPEPDVPLAPPASPELRRWE